MALKFKRCLGQSAVKVPVKFQSDVSILKHYLMALRLDGKTSYPLVNSGLRSLCQHAISSLHNDNVALTHLPLVPHIYASVNLISIGLGNGFLPIQCQAII